MSFYFRLAEKVSHEATIILQGVEHKFEAFEGVIKCEAIELADHFRNSMKLVETSADAFLKKIEKKSKKDSVGIEAPKVDEAPKAEEFPKE